MTLEELQAENARLKDEVKMLQEDLGRLQEDYFAAERGAGILNRELQRMKALFQT
jgi:hypothetical protein